MPLMTKDQLLERMRGILAAERDALKRLDGLAMECASDAKEAVLAELTAVPYEARAPYIEALCELQPELRENMILLTQAAALIADARRKARKPAPQQLAS